MTCNLLLSLDLSTTCTGYALFDITTKELVAHGFIKPDFRNPIKRGIITYTYPRAQIYKLRELVNQIMTDETLKLKEVKYIVIEEVNRGISRLPQKTLDGYHFMLLNAMDDATLDKVRYVDSDGKCGWRSRGTGLSLQLSEQDKLLNKENKKINKKASRGHKVPIITQKHLACRLVNKKFNLNLDVDARAEDSDMADAIGLGLYYVTKVLK